MDLSFRAIHDIVHPTAVYSRPDDEEHDGHVPTESGHGHDDDDDNDDEYDNDNNDNNDNNSGYGSDDTCSWDKSQLNPKNRIDSLGPLPHPLWRIDGSAGLGTQYYAIPLFLTHLPPMHIDVFVHEGALYPPVLRRLLDLDKAFHIKGSERLRHLGITQHLLHILQWHTTHADGSLHQNVVAELYRRGPFGSRLVVENLSCHIHESRIAVSSNYPLEGDLMAYQDLLAMWGLAGDGQARPADEGGEGDKGDEMRHNGTWLPREVDVQDVELVQQLHDSICLVYIHDGRQGGPRERQLVVLKSVIDNVKYMYHELRALLVDIPLHAHVIGRPLHVVSKVCLFGGKRGVIGFTIPYYAAGSLRDHLPLLRIHGQLALADQLRWATQLSQALSHIWHCGHSFYPDLRLDNIVLGAPPPAGDIVVVDFEQRGVWCGFGAPEVDVVDHVRIVAGDEADADATTAAAEEMSERCKRELAACWAAADPAHRDVSCGWTSTLGRLEAETRYSNPAQGYNVSWICLTRREQEAAMVYMLGRVLWCICEGQSAPHRGAVWMSYRREPDAVEFPEFARTPPALQALITQCIGIGDTGVPVAQQDRFVRLASKLYMKADPGPDPEDGPDTAARAGSRLVADNLPARARAFWEKRLAEGTTWLAMRNRRLQQAYEDGKDGKDGESEDEGKEENTAEYGRPTLRQVVRRLEELRRELS